MAKKGIEKKIDTQKATALGLPGHCLGAAGPLPGGCRATAWGLPGHCLGAARPLPGGCRATA